MTTVAYKVTKTRLTLQKYTSIHKHQKTDYKKCNNKQLSSTFGK